MQESYISPHLLSRPRTAALRDGTQIFVRKSQEFEVATIQQQVQREIAGKVASLNSMLGFFHRNSDSFWSICDNETQERRGCILFLFPSFAAIEAIRSYTLDTTEPPIDLFVASGSRPAAVYIWAVVARRMGREALMLVAQELSPELYGGIPIYTRAGSIGGLNALMGSGAANSDTPKIGGVFEMSVPSGSAA